MADFFVSSGLNEDELEEFLKEIDTDEPQTDFYQDEKHKLPQKEKLIYVGKVEKTIKPTYTPDEKAALMRKGRAQSLADKRRRAKMVKRDFVMSGNVMGLSEPVSKDTLKLIITHMTESFYEKANTTMNKLTTEIEKELRRYVPMTLKVLYRTNRHAFAENVGFEYETSPYYGNAKLHIKPDIPSVFKDPNEMQVLRAKCSHRLFTFDKLVERYYMLTKRRVQVETAMAIRLRKVNMVVDLLNISIDYYDAYVHVMNTVKNENK